MTTWLERQRARRAQGPVVDAVDLVVQKQRELVDPEPVLDAVRAELPRVVPFWADWDGDGVPTYRDPDEIATALAIALRIALRLPKGHPLREFAELVKP